MSTLRICLAEVESQYAELKREIAKEKQKALEYVDGVSVAYAILRVVCWFEMMQ